TNVDIFFETPSGTVVTEIKSCNSKNFHSQIRRGVAQLLEYRFVYQALWKGEPIMLLVVETVPPADKMWLVDYVKSLGIVLAWKQSPHALIVSTCELVPALDGIVNPA